MFSKHFFEFPSLEQEFEYRRTARANKKASFPKLWIGQFLNWHSPAKRATYSCQTLSFPRRLRRARHAEMTACET